MYNIYTSLEIRNSFLFKLLEKSENETIQILQIIYIFEIFFKNLKK